MTFQEWWEQFITKISVILSDIISSINSDNTYSAQEWKAELDNAINNVTESTFTI